jgi:hypothetical protein
VACIFVWIILSNKEIFFTDSWRNQMGREGRSPTGCSVRSQVIDVAELQTALEPLLACIESVTEQIREYNERIEKLAQDSYPQVALLKQIKGDGHCVAAPCAYGVPLFFSERGGLLAASLEHKCLRKHASGDRLMRKSCLRAFKGVGHRGDHLVLQCRSLASIGMDNVPQHPECYGVRSDMEDDGFWWRLWHYAIDTPNSVD